MEKIMKELLVIKVGSSTLVDDAGRLDDASFCNLATQVQDQLELGREIVIVSSGAVSAGANELGISRDQLGDDLDNKSAFAAVGQVPLMTKWAGYLHPIKTAQNLITPRELGDDQEGDAYIRKLKATIDLGVVAIVNENDAVADEEIKVGDNDQLSAMVAARLQRLGGWQARLIMLSDVDGLFTSEPDNDDARLIRRVDDIHEVSCFVDERESLHGTGGMATKLLAAQIVNEAGVPMFLGNGREANVVERLIQGITGTGFFTQNVCHLVE